MSKQPEQKSHRSEKHDQGIIRDQLGQEQPVDQDRARQVSRKEQPGEPAGEMPQR